MAKSSKGNTISVCIIARNEEKNIPNVLSSAKKFADEIVVVDTGSTDRTPEIAREFGAKVYFFQWCDDFSAARNESLKHATCDWIMWLDADDVIDDFNIEKIIELKKNLPPTKDSAYYFLIESKIIESKDSSSRNDAWYWYQLRLFPRHEEIKFEGRIHEQVIFSIEKLKIKQKYTTIKITHTGYHDPEKLQQKMQRNIRLLEEEEKSNPSFWIKRYLAFSYAKLGRIEDALRKLDEALSLIPQNAYMWLYDLHMLGVDIRRFIGDWDKVLYHLGEAEKVRPDEGALNLAKSEVFFVKGEFEKALDELEKARKKGFLVSLIPISPDSLKRKYFMGKARVLYHLKRYDESLRNFEQLVNMSPEYIIEVPQALDEFVDCAGKCEKWELIYETLKKIEDKLEPHHISNLAFASERLGKIEDAKNYYEKAYSMMKDENPDILFNYAHFEFMYGNDLSKTIDLFKRYLEVIQPTKENSVYILTALTALANIFLKLGEVKFSVELLSTACEIAGVKVVADSFSDLSYAWVRISEKFSNKFLKTVALQNATLLLNLSPEKETDKEVYDKIVAEIEKITSQVISQ
ncbi:SPBc2 prophage-derived glycosyltransferase SunS [bacterium HR19]|nr:SPBc2 prophage-derived glycosyltransferase SunS [bacterium HR19]